MSSPEPLIHGSVQVTWNADGTVNQITYQSLPLIDAVNQRLHPLLLGQAETISSNENVLKTARQVRTFRGTNPAEF